MKLLCIRVTFSLCRLVKTKKLFEPYDKIRKNVTINVGNVGLRIYQIDIFRALTLVIRHLAQFMFLFLAIQFD